METAVLEQKQQVNAVVKTEPHTELSIFNDLKAKIELLKVENAAMVFDVNTPDGEKACCSHIYKLRLVKGKIKDAHSIAKSNALAICKAVDATRNELDGEMEQIINVHYPKIQALEAKRAAEALAKLQAEQAEKQRIENERLEAIRKQQEENNRKEAELKAKEEALAKAEADRKAAEDAKRKADEEAEAKRVADEAHRKDIENDIMNDIVTIVNNLKDDDIAETFHYALVTTAIRHITINY